MKHKGTNDGNAFETQIAYIHGRIEHELEGFAKSLDISQSYLTARLGALLIGVQGREVLRSKNSMPAVRLQTTKPSKRKSKVEKSVSPRKNKSQVKKPSGIKAYWAAMSSLQRRREMARRMAIKQAA